MTNNATFDAIEKLLQAAEFIERREREAEHGYASTMPMPEELNRRRLKPKKSQGNRSTHNELEKNRRAHLRHCLERLKELVPLGADASRHTTLGLLTKAKSMIKSLEDRERRQTSLKEQLNREQRYLRRRLENLTNGQYRIRVERSISECSSATSISSVSSEASVSSVSSNSAASESAESDEVDILGYGSSTSDTDDHSSIQSSSSDGGCAITTRRLTLSEML